MSEDKEYREAFKHEKKFSTMTICRVILAMVPLVEKAIGEELKEAGYGAIMHDGWT